MIGQRWIFRSKGAKAQTKSRVVYNKAHLPLRLRGTIHCTSTTIIWQHCTCYYFYNATQKIESWAWEKPTNNLQSSHHRLVFSQRFTFYIIIMIIIIHSIHPLLFLPSPEFYPPLLPFHSPFFFQILSRSHLGTQNNRENKQKGGEYLSPIRFY